MRRVILAAPAPNHVDRQPRARRRRGCAGEVSHGGEAQETRRGRQNIRAAYKTWQGGKARRHQNDPPLYAAPREMVVEIDGAPRFIDDSGVIRGKIIRPAFRRATALRVKKDAIAVLE